jgi:hypothetical protein
MTQVKATPMMAWFSPKRKLLMGLHTTTYRSMARTTRDHRAISPARQSVVVSLYLLGLTCFQREGTPQRGTGDKA